MAKSDRLVPLTKGEQTRRKLVAAAAPVFNQHGYEGSSLSDLMAATGLKKGGIYRHFSSKESLAAAAFDYTWEAVRTARMLHVDEKATALEQLQQLIANFIDYKSPVAGGCPILNTAVDADDGNPVLRARVGKALRSWVARVESIIKQSVKDGELGPEVDPKSLATLIVAGLEGAIMMSRLDSTDYALRQVQQHWTSYLKSQQQSGPVKQ